MKIINDISNRHGDIQNDIFYNALKTNDILKTSAEKSFFFSTRKTEKIVTALYLVTDVMEPELPLTKSLRLESLDLLNACYHLLTSSSKMVPSEIVHVILRMEHVTSLVSIGRITHHISDMNAEVLLTEMAKVTEALTVELSELSSQHATYNHSRRTTEESFQPVIPFSILEDVSFDEITKNRKRQNDIKNTLTTKFDAGPNPLAIEKKQNDILPIKTTSSKKPFDIKNTKKDSVDKNSLLGSRKQQIINVVTSHKNATMQDIQKFITDCSDKTLQREIVSLVGLGVIRKEGDKRWATYHMI
jgi:hypothetical protein